MKSLVVNMVGIINAFKLKKVLSMEVVLKSGKKPWLIKHLIASDIRRQIK
jgi:hypothetical protein